MHDTHTTPNVDSRHTSESPCTWSTGFKLDALRRAPAEASGIGLLAPAPKRAIILPAEAIVIQACCVARVLALGGRGFTIPRWYIHLPRKGLIHHTEPLLLLLFNFRPVRVGVQVPTQESRARPAMSARRKRRTVHEDSSDEEAVSSLSRVDRISVDYKYSGSPARNQRLRAWTGVLALLSLSP